MCFGSFTDGLATGNGTSDTAHAKLEECLGRFRFRLEKIVDCRVCG